MSLSDTDVKKIYTGNGSTTTFAITFDYDDETEVVVILRDESTTPATETTQTSPTEYSISGVNVEMVTAPAATEKLLIIRSNPLTQTLDLLGSGSINAETLEGNLDKITRICQELNEKITRSAKIPQTYPNEGSGGISDLALPEPSANKVLAWNADADAIENVTVDSADQLSVMTTKGDLASYSTAAARLAVGTNGRVLQASSSQDTGLRWSIPSMGKPGLIILAGGPTEDVENNIEVLKFQDGITQQVAFNWRVPSNYVAGQQLLLRMLTYTPSTSLTTLVTGVTTLLESLSSAASSTTNQHTSTNSAITASATANRLDVQSVDLTDSSGEINGVAVAPGDLLVTVLSRNVATDTDTADMRLVKWSPEVFMA